MLFSIVQLVSSSSITPFIARTPADSDATAAAWACAADTLTSLGSCSFEGFSPRQPELFGPPYEYPIPDIFALSDQLQGHKITAPGTVVPLVPGDSLPIHFPQGFTAGILDSTGWRNLTESPVSFPCQGRDLAREFTPIDGNFLQWCRYCSPELINQTVPIDTPTIPANIITREIGYPDASNTGNLYSLGIGVPADGTPRNNAFALEFDHPVAAFSFYLTPLSERRVCNGPHNVEMPDFPRLEVALFNAADELVYEVNPSLDDTTFSTDPEGAHFIGFTSQCNVSDPDSSDSCGIVRAVIYHKGFASEDGWAAIMDNVTMCHAMPSTSLAFTPITVGNVVAGADNADATLTATAEGPSGATDVHVAIVITPEPADPTAVDSMFVADPSTPNPVIYADGDFHDNSLCPVVSGTVLGGDEVRACAVYLWNMTSLGVTDTADINISVPIASCAENGTTYEFSSWLWYQRGAWINGFGVGQELVPSPRFIEGSALVEPLPCDDSTLDLEILTASATPACSPSLGNPAELSFTVVNEVSLLLLHEAAPDAFPVIAGEPDVEWGNGNYTTILANEGPSCVRDLDLWYNLTGAPLAGTTRAFQGHGFTGPFAPDNFDLQAQAEEFLSDWDIMDTQAVSDDDDAENVVGFADFSFDGEHHPDTLHMQSPIACTSSSSIETFDSVFTSSRATTFPSAEGTGGGIPMRKKRQVPGNYEEMRSSEVSTDDSSEESTSSTDDVSDYALTEVYWRSPTRDPNARAYFNQCRVTFDWDTSLLDSLLVGDAEWRFLVGAGEDDGDEDILYVLGGTGGAESGSFNETFGTDHFRFIIGQAGCPAAGSLVNVSITNFTFDCEWPLFEFGTYDSVTGDFVATTDDDDASRVDILDEGFHLVVDQLDAGEALRVLHPYSITDRAAPGTLTSTVRGAVNGSSVVTVDPVSFTASADITVEQEAELVLNWTSESDSEWLDTVVAGAPYVFEAPGDDFTQTTADSSVDSESDLAPGFTSTSTSNDDDDGGSSMDTTTTFSMESSTSGSTGPRLGNLLKKLTVENNGPSIAESIDIDLSFALPDGVRLIAVTSTAGAVDDPANPALWSLDERESWSTETLYLLYQVDACADADADIVCDASATASTPLTVSPATAQGTIDIIADVWLRVDVSSSENPATVACEEPTTVLTTTVYNEGPSCLAAGSDVHIQISMPDAGVHIVNETAPAVSPAGAGNFTGFVDVALNGTRSGIFTLAVPLSPAAPLTVSFDVNADASVAGEVDGIVYEAWIRDVLPLIAANSEERVPADEYDVERVTLVGIANLLIEIIDNGDPAIAGAKPVQHIVMVTHAERDPLGPSLPARDVVVSHIYGFVDDTGLAFDFATADVGSVDELDAPGERSGALRWSIGTVNPGDQFNMTLNFTVASSAKVCPECIQSKATLSAEKYLDCLPVALRATDDDYAVERTSIARRNHLQVVSSVGIKTLKPVIDISNTGHRHARTTAGVYELAVAVSVSNDGPSDSAAAPFNITYDLPESAVVEETAVSQGTLSATSSTVSQLQYWLTPIAADEEVNFIVKIRVYDNKGQALLPGRGQRVVVAMLLDEDAMEEQVINDSAGAAAEDPVGLTVVRYLGASS